MFLITVPKLQTAVLASTCLALACLVGIYSHFTDQTAQPPKQLGRGQNYVSFNISPSGDDLVFAAQGKKSSDLFLLALKPSQVSAVTDDTTFEQQPAFAPDGKQVVFAASDTADGTAHIFTCPLNGGKRQQLTSSDRYDTSPAFSRDGTHIVFARAARHRPYSMGGWTWDQWDVFMMNADGSDVKQVTTSRYYQLTSPVLSPDNKQILFSVTHGEAVQRDICAASSDGTSQPVMLTHDGHSSDPSYSPDGSRIVFIADTAKNFDYELWLMKSDGTEPAQLTHTGSYSRAPRFMPDSKHILYLTDPARQSRYDLMQIDTNGDGLKKIADSSLFDNPMKWKP